MTTQHAAKTSKKNAEGSNDNNSGGSAVFQKETAKVYKDPTVIDNVLIRAAKALVSKIRDMVTSGSSKEENTASDKGQER